MRVLLSYGILALAVGCATGPDYQRPEIALPDAWRTPTANLPYNHASWTNLYRDPVLSELISRAVTNSPDARSAIARIDEAAAALRIQRAAYFPTVNGSASYTKGRVGNLPPLPGAEAEQFDLFGLLSYELDVWGRIRRLNEVALAQFLATEDAAQTVKIGLVAGVASTYFNLRTFDRQLEIAVDTLASRSNLLELTFIKFDDGNGIVSELDVAQAQTQVAGAQSTIAGLRRQIVVTENALSILLGDFPRAIPRGLSIEEQAEPESIPTGLPSELLLRRPDIRTAEQNLIAANANIGVARAAYFPAISLTGAFGLQSEDLDKLFDTGLSRSWNFKPSITTPIFNAGKIRAGVNLARAQQQTALIEYERSIQHAFREVDDSLSSIMHLREELKADQDVVRAESRRLELAQLRYEGGVASYSDVLDAQRFLFNAQLTEVQTRNALLNTMVQLHRALGGDVDPTP